MDYVFLMLFGTRKTFFFNVFSLSLCMRGVHEFSLRNLLDQLEISRMLDWWHKYSEQSSQPNPLFSSRAYIQKRLKTQRREKSFKLSSYPNIPLVFSIVPWFFSFHSTFSFFLLRFIFICVTTQIWGRWPQKGWIWERSHIDWRKERVPAKTLAPKWGELSCPTLFGEENKPVFIRVWKPSPSRRVLKPWGKARKGKPKEDNFR